MLAPNAHGASSDPLPIWQDALDWQGRHVNVAVEALDVGRARFVLRSTDAAGMATERMVEEDAAGPRLRTGSPLFDALYALALEEARLDSVEQITDGQFNDGHPIPCRCFQTGAKWPYVWTRDISYSTDLGLALLDPVRAGASLFFKQSELRAGPMTGRMPAARVVAQDTGSGGSWPVSTDRVIWIHAAMDVADAMPNGSADATKDLLRIAADTLEQDRRYAFDQTAGLYRGETSFLDWREQTYPAWTRTDTRFIAEGFSLSTNVAHYIALLDAQRLARRAHAAMAAAYGLQAKELRDAINHRFWDRNAGLYASYLSRDLAPVAAYDLLGLALAVTSGVADTSAAREIVGRYPLTLAGPPVIWPEQEGIAIYHNRAIWPFVTAYALQAARVVRDAPHMTAFAESLIRGAALNLSNFENQEFLTQQTAFADGVLSGPVINSARQLWSVAAYAGMVTRDLFGVQIGSAGTLRVAPSIPGGLAHRMFVAGRELRLDGLDIGGRSLSVTLVLPAHWTDHDLLQADVGTLNGRPWHPDTPLPPGSLQLRVELVPVAAPGAFVRIVDARDPHALTPDERRILFAPAPPTLTLASQSGDEVVLVPGGIVPGNDWQLQRDGVVLAGGVGDAPLRIVRELSHAACYTATQSWPGPAGHRSLPSRELCVAPSHGTRLYLAGTGALRSPDGHPVDRSTDTSVYRDWGAPGERLEFLDTATVAGLQRLRVMYGNAYGPINTGITAAVKEVTAECPGLPAQRGAIVMPHRDAGDAVGPSTAFVFRAPQGRPCRIVIADGTNMTDLEHFALYTSGRGGRAGPWNRAGIYSATLEPIAEPTAR